MKTPFKFTSPSSGKVYNILFIHTQGDLFEKCCKSNKISITFDHYIGKFGVKRNSLVGPEFYANGTITYLGNRDGIDMFAAMNPEDTTPTIFMGSLKTIN